MSDAEIARAVRRFLALMVEDSGTVRVEVEGGIVYLEGLAANARQKQKIQSAVKRVAGVGRIINCLSLEHVANLRAAPSLVALQMPFPDPWILQRQAETFLRN